VITPPPELGQHTLDILREVGFDDAQVAALRAEGTI
jgi:crotonobetainyl-CoA:carnitine CoA-transferase CaiB-like acyl-CoA transferase